MSYPNTPEGEAQRQKEKITNDKICSRLISEEEYRDLIISKLLNQRNLSEEEYRDLISKLENQITHGCIPLNITPFRQEDEKYTNSFDIDLESLAPISNHTMPLITGIAALAGVVENPQFAMTYLSFICSLFCFRLRSHSKSLSKINRESDEFRSNAPNNKIKRGIINTAHLSAFMALAYVTANSVMEVIKNSDHLKEETLIVAGSCCAYQLAAIGLKKAKLHTR